MDKTLIACVGDLVTDDQFPLNYLWAIDVVELTSYLVKVGFQNRHVKDITLAVDNIHISCSRTTGHAALLKMFIL